MSNMIVVDTKFKLIQVFEKAIVKEFAGKVLRMDFKAADTVEKVNGQVCKMTKGMIKDCLDKIDPLDVCILVNVVHFKGKWMQPFDPKLTYLGDFTCDNGKTAKTTFMHSFDCKAGLLLESSVRYLSIPYCKDDYRLVVEMPMRDAEASQKSLFDVKSDQSRVLRAANCKLQAVNLFMPKFRIELNSSIVDVLQSMGIRKVFQSGGVQAIASSPLRVSEVQHRCVIEVDEEGSEAAAVTTITLGKSARKHLPIDFKVNSPFYFHIVERKTGLCLFSGAMSTVSQ